MSEAKKGSKLMEFFDAMFILILCFATLLSAMLLKGKSISGMNYSIHYCTMAAMFIGICVYIAYVLTHAEKGLRGMISALYDEE